MKHLLTLLFSIIASSLLPLQAQVVLTYGGKVVDPTQTLDVYANVIDYSLIYGPAFDYVVIDCGKDDPILTNLGNSSAPYSITVTTNDYRHFRWCGITDMCKDMTSKTEKRSGTLTPGASTPLYLEAVLTENNFATYTAKVDIQNGTNTISYNLRFIYTAAAPPSSEYDVNHDGRVSLSDLNALLRYLLEH